MAAAASAHHAHHHHHHSKNVVRNHASLLLVPQLLRHAAANAFGLNESSAGDLAFLLGVRPHDHDNLAGNLLGLSASNSSAPLISQPVFAAKHEEMHCTATAPRTRCEMPSLATTHRP